MDNIERVEIMPPLNADDEQCRRVWLITSNDNLGALTFYQKRGYRMVAIHVGAIDIARQVKQTIPLLAENGIEIHDEIELEKILGR